MPEALLQARGVEVRFGGLVAVDGVDLEVRAGEFVGVIGPNGAGKTTFFHTLSGVLRPSAGQLLVAGEDLTGHAPHEFARSGVARTFQTPRVFHDMSAEENVRFGLEFAGRAGKRARGGFDDAGAILAFLGLADAADLPAGGLTPARQRLLEIGMALGARPRVLLLDEVAAGLTHAELDATARLIRRLRDELGLAVIWIEHAVRVLMDHVDRVAVLHQGRKIADGDPRTVARDPAVIEAYLGVESGPVRRGATPAPRGAGLAVRGLAAGYGALRVLQGVDLEAPPNELTVIVGANGAGKTTLLKALSGLIPRSGEVSFDGLPLPAAPAAIVARGLAQVPEGRQLFAQMTVRENLELGAYLLPGMERVARLARVLELFPRLQERRAQLAGTLSGGEQQMLAVGRALMGRPKMLMLDEPSLGLAPRMVDELLAIVRRIRDDGVGVLLVEQNVAKALAIADGAYVMERGAVVMRGPAAQLLDSERLREAYLGTDTRR